MPRSVSTNRTLRCVKLFFCTGISMFIIIITVRAVEKASQTLHLSVQLKRRKSNNETNCQCLTVWSLDSTIRSLVWRFLAVELTQNLGQFWVEIGSNLTKNWVNFGLILGQFWINFGSILGQFWVNFGSILGQKLHTVKFGSILG